MSKYYKLDMKSLKDAAFNLKIGSKEPLTAGELITILEMHNNYKVYIYGDGNGARHVRIRNRENRIDIYE